VAVSGPGDRLIAECPETIPGLIQGCVYAVNLYRFSLSKQPFLDIPSGRVYFTAVVAVFQLAADRQRLLEASRVRNRAKENKD
jgi:hypothetical protein